MIEKWNAKWCRRRALGAARQFGPWIVVSLLLVAALGQANSAALAGLFQSPTDTPTPAPTATITPTVEATLTLTPTIEVEPTLAPTVEVEPTAVPTDTPVPIEPTLVVPPVVPELVETPVLTATAQVDEGSAQLGLEPGPSRYPDEGSDLQFEWGMLFDSVALGLSYVWLGCGVLFMLLLPALFLVIWIVARRRRRAIE